MFDIKPVDSAGGIDVEKISRVEEKISLIKHQPVAPVTRETLIGELQQELRNRSNSRAVLAKIGGAFVPSRIPTRWRRQIFVHQKTVNDQRRSGNSFVSAVEQNFVPRSLMEESVPVW